MQIHLAAGLLGEVARILGGGPWRAERQPDVLELHHPGVPATANALAAAAAGHAPRLAAEALAQALAAQLIAAGPPARSAAPGRPGARPLSPAQLQRVVDHLHAHLDQDVGLAERAALVHTSRAHFLRAFAAATGLTPHRYLTVLRPAGTRPRRCRDHRVHVRIARWTNVMRRSSPNCSETAA